VIGSEAEKLNSKQDRFPMFSILVDLILGACRHRRQSMPFTLNNQTYTVCMDCGRGNRIFAGKNGTVLRPVQFESFEVPPSTSCQKTSGPASLGILMPFMSIFNDPRWGVFRSPRGSLKAATL
jgi:hypothetical protein